jgi:hypothetical protein
MSEQRKIDLQRMLEKNGTVTLDIVPHDGSEPYSVEVNHYEQAVGDIDGLIYENEIYF